jgi:hypothetical protein
VSLIHIEGQDAESRSRVDKLVDNYARDSLSLEMAQSKQIDAPIREEKQIHHGYPVGTFTQMRYLLQRNFRDIFREPLK